LIDGGREVKLSRARFVSSNIVNREEVIIPRRSTHISNIGFSTLINVYLFGIENTSIKGSIEPFIIPRSDGIEFKFDCEEFMSWEIIEISGSGNSRSELTKTSDHSGSLAVSFRIGCSITE
jgi:hypothetical protein